jgi:hypothetical protein
MVLLHAQDFSYKCFSHLGKPHNKNGGAHDPTGNKRQPDACISTVDINYYKHATYIGDGVSECLKSGKDVKTACYAWEAGMSNLSVAHEPWEDLHRTPILRPLDHCPLLLHSQNHTTGPPMFRYLRCTGR